MLTQAICHSEAKTQTFTSRKTILTPREGQKIMCFVIHGHHQSILHIHVCVFKKQNKKKNSVNQWTEIGGVK